MKVERRELIDCESILMTVHAAHELSKEGSGHSSTTIGDLREAKAPHRDGGESCPVAVWQDSDDRKTLRFYWEKWFPEDWIEPLAAALKAAVPSLQLLEIGQDFEPPYRDSTAFIAVPPRVVELTDGRKVDVPPFEIAKYTVSIAQIDHFTKETRYKTEAEQGHYPTIRENQINGNDHTSKRHFLAAFYISYRDALAYCEWAGVRLPSEAEWVAGASELRNDPSAPVMYSGEMTGTVVDGRYVIVCSEPQLVRRQGELRLKYDRSRRRLADFDDPIEFRVCR